jgi:hypothetical protein
MFLRFLLLVRFRAKNLVCGTMEKKMLTAINVYYIREIQEWDK